MNGQPPEAPSKKSLQVLRAIFDQEIQAAMRTAVERARPQGCSLTTPIEVGVVVSALLEGAVQLIAGAACAASGARQTGAHVRSAREIALKHQEQFAREVVEMLGIFTPAATQVTDGDQAAATSAEPAPGGGPI